ncbi:MAG: enolase C-terminal domain-like protein [Planctomycetota bacterium]
MSLIQPDATNCEGVTGWLKVAKMASERGVSLCSHRPQEFMSVSFRCSQMPAGLRSVVSPTIITRVARW